MNTKGCEAETGALDLLVLLVCLVAFIAFVVAVSNA